MSTGLRAGTNNDGYLQVNGTDVLTALSSGKIGLGTSTPTYELDVVGDINFTGSLNQNGSPFSGGGDSTWTTASGDDIYRLNGDVGIGTTNPQYKLDVNSTYSRFFTSNGFSGIQISSSSITDVKWTDTTNDRGWVWSNRGDGNFALITENPASVFSEKLRVLAGGGITFNGDTAVANALDDYEEGTYSPVMTGGGYTYGIGGYQAGRYTKIGRQVTVDCMINISTISGSSDGSPVRITLPFAPVQLSIGARWAQTPCRLVYFNSTAIQRIYCVQLTTNSSSLDLVYYYTSGGNGTDAPVNIGADYQSASNNGQIAFTISYITS
jgi:hypothetical protein